jgi:hypothetical protein
VSYFAFATVDRRYVPRADVMTISASKGDRTMLKITVVAALLAGSASVALAQLDGDANRIPGGQSGVFARQMPSGFEGAYATSAKPTRRSIEVDGDANPVPGGH